MSHERDPAGVIFNHLFAAADNRVVSLHILLVLFASQFIAVAVPEELGRSVGG